MPCVLRLHRVRGGLAATLRSMFPALNFLLAGSRSGMGDDDDSSRAATFGLHLSSCLRNSRSVWKTLWGNSLLAFDPKPRLPQPLGPLPLVVPSSVPDALSAPSTAPSTPRFVRSEGLEQVCAKMAKFKHSSWEVMLNEERNLAVNKWLSLILLEPLAFGVARNFYASKASGIASGSLGDSVSDCLASKATSTINARANSLLRYVSWAKVKLTCIFPLTEHAIYAFFEEKQTTAAATSFRSLLSAIAFAQHVVGLEGGDRVYTSGRVRGHASKLYMQKRKLKQRNPLRVADVVLLERICCNLEGKSVQDRYAAGFFLFLIYARARYSDGQNVASLADSPKYLESKVGRSKTSFTLERKTRFLPMAARKVGVKHAWAAAWLEVMGETGVTVTQANPLLPCPSSTSSWKMIPLPCDQAGAWRTA